MDECERCGGPTIGREPFCDTCFELIAAAWFRSRGMHRPREAEREGLRATLSRRGWRGAVRELVGYADTKPLVRPVLERRERQLMASFANGRGLATLVSGATWIGAAYYGYYALVDPTMWETVPSRYGPTTPAPHVLAIALGAALAGPMVAFTALGRCPACGANSFSVRFWAPPELCLHCGARLTPRRGSG